MDYKNPLILTLSSSNTHQSDTNLFNVDVRQRWTQIKDDVNRIVQNSDFDYIVVSYDKNSKNLKTLDLVTNEISKLGTNHRVPVVTRFDNQIYQLNLKHGEGSKYMPSNETVMDRYSSFESKEEWQHQQAQVWDKLKQINLLNSGSYGTNHLAVLTAPSRGLTEREVHDIGFFSIRGNQTLNPNLLNYDMIGMPGVNARVTEDNFYYKDKLVSGGALSLAMMGSGYVIPMRNKNGDMAKFQVGADVSAYNLTIKAIAADGISIQNSEICDKNSRVYKFQFSDGSPSNLKATYADDKKVVFEDAKGQFEATIKEDIVAKLKERDYDIHPMINKLQVLPKSKYNWPAQGDMVGSKRDGLDVPKIVSPSVAGFIPVSEPTNPENGYTVLVVEGALKGHIVASHLKHKDLADINQVIAGEGQGLIVAQVPGVAKAFLESVLEITDRYDVKNMVVAMDADGRYNKSVATGIHTAVEVLGDVADTRVMSWNPDQKGLDDALIALSRNEITREDFGLTFGTATELFPLDQAEAPNPYRLDGTRANRESWREEYNDGLLEREAMKRQIQDQSRQHEPSNNPVQSTSPELEITPDEPVQSEPVPMDSRSGQSIGQIEPQGIDIIPPMTTPVVDEVSKSPTIYTVEPEVLKTANEKLTQGDLSTEEIQAFMQSVSDLSKDFYDMIHNIAEK